MFPHVSNNRVRQYNYNNPVCPDALMIPSLSLAPGTRSSEHVEAAEWGCTRIYMAVDMIINY